MQDLRRLILTVPVVFGLLTACSQQAPEHTNSAPSSASVMTGAALAAPTSATVPAAPLRLIQTIPLPGVEGRLDHLALDGDWEHLFVAALGNNSVEIIDLQTGKVLPHIANLHEPQGIGYFRSTSHIFIANGGNGVCDIYDSRPSGARYVTRTEVGDDADNVRCDDSTSRVYIGYGNGGLAVLDFVTGKLLERIPLAGHPESFQLERQGPRIFVNVPSAGHIAVVDRKQRQVVAVWPTGEVRANFPMALDEAAHRLFAGCRQPARVLVYDTASGQIVAMLNIDGDTDDLFWDARTKRLYASCGAGLLDVFQQRDANHYAALARIPTASGARTALFVPELKRLYLAVPRRGAEGAEIRVYATT